MIPQPLSPPTAAISDNWLRDMTIEILAKDLTESELRMLYCMADFFLTQKELFYLRYPEMRDDRFVKKARQVRDLIANVLDKTGVEKQ